MPAGPPRRRPARAVADAPINQLLARLDELTKGWLLAPLEQASLDEAPEILAADLPREGPRLCEAVVRALADDADLRRIEPDGQLELLVSRAGELAGAHTPEASVRAVDTLEAVIWSAVRSELGDADPDLMAEIAERLSRVAGLVRIATLRGATSTTTVPGSPSGTYLRPLPDPQRPGSAVAEPDRPDPSAHRPRGARGPRHGRGRRAGVGRRARPRAHPGAALRFVAVAAVARARGGRARSGRRAAGAQALAARTAGSVRMAQAWRGAPLTVSIGVAVLGEDGADSEELIDSAEQARLAAAVEGVGVHRVGPQDELLLGKPPMGGPEAG